jgi:hypothetical protein
MKKRGVVLLLISVLLFGIISVNFVSASLFEDIWNKITGKATENETGDGVGGEIPPDCMPAPQFCPDETTLCPRTTDEQGCSVWDCSSCETPPEPPGPGPEEEICCKITQLLECISCPPEVSYEVRLESECGYSLAPGAEESYEIVADGYCEESPPEKECEEGEIKYYICEDGTKIPECECENEAWICKISVKEECPDVGPEPETCAARIQITFNKEVYRIGDPVKIIIEIFDSEGNHLPNYAFYGQMYDDRWHTPDLHTTNDEGYFTHTGIAEKPAGGVTEVKFKIYTRETSSCSSVEDIEEVKFELEDCGIGECAPELECEDKIRMCGGECPPCPEDDDDGDIFYPCNGCELEDKCYPYGYRKAGDYCSDENDIFIDQSADDEECENNFECKTNLCINGNCVSSNLWNKFLEWFKKLFGDGDDEGPKDCSKLLIEKDIGDNEYEKSTYGVEKHAQVPVYSEDGENIGTIKCCLADYSTGATMVCPFDSKEDVKNSLKWILAGERGTEEFTEYKGEKVLANGMIAWTNKATLIVSGGKSEVYNRFVEAIVDAYLNKYKSDFDLTEDDIPYIEPEPESCEEITDNEEQAGCYIDLAMATSDASLCEKIIYNVEHRDKCYVVLAEHTGNANICEGVTDSSLREKCYFWVAEQTESDVSCEEMEYSPLQEECYVNLAEKTDDGGFCEKITTIHIRDKCYIKVGIQTKDRSLCEKIIEDRARQKCFDVITLLEE